MAGIPEMPRTIRAVLFDAGDVLYRRRRKTWLVGAFFERQGLPAPDYAGPELVRLKRAAHAGEITREQFFDAVLTSCGAAFSDGLRQEAHAVLDEAQGQVDFFPGVPETLHRLKAAGLRLGIVTNTFDSTETKRRWFSRVGIQDLWDSFATSCELKLLKPNPGIYLAALAPLDVYPVEAAFVGHSQSELVGAKRVGMTTVAFNRDDASVEGDIVIDVFDELPDSLAVFPSLVRAST